MHVIGASSLHKALESLQKDEKRKLRTHVTAIPGLSLNLRVKNPLKNLEFLLQKERLSQIDNLILWHDLVNSTITKHWRTNVPEKKP